MAARHSIQPFPDSIDRDYFGAWLSGFVDGEGCFMLGYHGRSKNGGDVRFSITLRQDDAPILDLIRSYLGCGAPVHRGRRIKRTTRPISPNEAPTALFIVKGIRQCWRFIVPHFDKYPLLAKKKRDYAIWREAIQFLHERVTRVTFDRRSRRRCGRPNWTTETKRRWEAFVQAIKAQRRFSANTNSENIVEVPNIEIAVPTVPRELTLFD